jgi:glucose/arabinose dehydrogenase/sugar lactone lactonase YvrE
MYRALCLAAVLTCTTATHAQADPPFKPFVTGMKNPESATVGMDDRVFVTVIGEFNKDGDGGVMVIENGKAVPFATGMDDPKGIVSYQKSLFVADKTRVWKVDPKGKAEVFVEAKDFPTPPIYLNDITVDPESGTLFISDSGDRKGKGGAVFRITPASKKMVFMNGKLETVNSVMKVDVVVDFKTHPELNAPNGLAMDGQSFLLLADFGSGKLYRIKLADKTMEQIADGIDGADGVAWDNFGRLYVSSWKTGKIFVIPRPGDRPILLAEGFQSAADICLDKSGKFLLVPDMKAGTLTNVPIGVPGAEVDDTPLKLETAVAFPELKWTGWKGETDSGKIFPLRPLLLTHAGDGSNRVFVGIQQGIIHVFPNNPKADKTKIFLDIQKQVLYKDNENEQGLLGLAFHPKYAKNGEFFVFYSTRQKPLTSILSRFKVSKDDPDKADPASEEELLRIERPFWNHDGGTICFGPDGYLYVALGDGGFGGDPKNNGQNLNTLLAKILRIDVDRKEPGKNYAIPKDNPFVNRADARPEIWAWGLRNVWRMSFDRKTGQLWAADVGQNLYEEINLITKGGNYGWSRREGLHPFGAKGVGPIPELIEPIWEYHHNVGKSITGGHVYRGKKLPELDGAYLYADYVSGKIWALRYDEAKKRVVANQPIRDRNLPIMSFGEDEMGEVYLMTYTNNGQGIYQIIPSKE